MIAVASWRFSQESTYEPMIQVLAGRLAVEVGAQTHELGAGQLLALGPRVPHTVRALSPSEMLLTVHMIER